MQTTKKISDVMTEERVLDIHTWVDAVAIGAGVYARLKELGLNVNAFKGGESPTEKTNAEKLLDPIEYTNMRAECFWRGRMWILQGGGLTPHKDWAQLSKIKYRVTSDKKIQIMSKEEMRARGDLGASESTDVPDAWSMTFVPSSVKFNMNAVASTPNKPYYPDIDGGSNQNTPRQSEGGFNHDFK